MESCSSRESDVHSIDVRRYCTVDLLDRSNNRPTDGRTRRTARRLEGRKRRLMDMFYSDGLRASRLGRGGGVGRPMRWKRRTAPLYRRASHVLPRALSVSRICVPSNKINEMATSSADVRLTSPLFQYA